MQKCELFKINALESIYPQRFPLTFGCNQPVPSAHDGLFRDILDEWCVGRQVRKEATPVEPHIGHGDLFISMSACMKLYEQRQPSTRRAAVRDRMTDK